MTVTLALLLTAACSVFLPDPAPSSLTVSRIGQSAPISAVKDWCATKTEDQLRSIRADLGGVRLSFNTSPTHGKYFFTPTYPTMTMEQRKIARAEYKQRGYTHFLIGPIVERGYPGWAGHDFRTRPADWVALLEELWQDDLIPVYAGAIPDGPYNVKTAPGEGANPVSVAKLDAGLLAIYKRADFQRAVCVTTVSWEGTDKDWINTVPRAVAVTKWVKKAFPRAFIYWHGGEDSGAPCSYKEDGHGCEGKAWRAMAPFIHGQFWQTGSASANDVDLFLDNLRYEVMRFHTDHYRVGGLRGADGKVLDVIFGEGSAYYELNRNAPESWGIYWGTLAMTVPGVRGFGDGGPPRR
jgi:hypothetical protein